MKNKKSLLLFTASLSVFAIATSMMVIGGKRAISRSVIGDGKEYTLTLNSSNAPADLTSSFQKKVSGAVTTTDGNEMNFDYIFAKAADGGLVTLGNGGRIQNSIGSSGYNNRITGINSITVTYSGSGLTLRTSTRNDGLELGNSYAVTSASPINLGDAPYYFALDAGDSNVTISEVEIKYACAENSGVYLSHLAGVYTGHGNDGYTWKLTLNGSAAVIETLDRAGSQLTFNATAEILANGQAKCSFQYNTYNIFIYYNVSADGATFTLDRIEDEVGGAAASQVAHINFSKVYTVDDFESYSATGKGYDNKNSKDLYALQGMRANYVAAYNGNPTNETWNLMGADDYMTYSAEGGHNNSKVAILKAATGNNYRYMQIKGLKQIPQIAGKGSKVSFWAAGSISSLATGTQGNQDVKVDVLVFNTPNYMTNNHQNMTVTTVTPAKVCSTITIPAGTNWKQYIADISDVDGDIYGVGFRIYKTASATAYLPIDDIQIFNENPWAKPDVAPTGVQLNKDVAYLYPGESLTLEATVLPEDATNKAVSWTSSNTSIATVSNGVVTAVAAGTATITVTTEQGGLTDTLALTVDEKPTFLSGLFVGDVNVQITSPASMSTHFPLAIASGDQGHIEVCFNGQNVGVERFVRSGNNFTLVTSRSVKFNVSALGNAEVIVNVGTLTGTINNGTFEDITLTGESISSEAAPTLAATVSNDGDIDLALQNTVYTNNCDGSDAQLQAVFGRRKRENDTKEWEKDTSNADRLVSNTANRVDGTASMRIRGWNDGQVQLTLKDDMPEAYRGAFNNISFWVYNDSAKVHTIKLFIYKAADFGSNQNIADYVIQPGQWTFVTCGYKVSIYNLAIFLNQVNTNVMSFDNFCLYNHS